MKKPSLKATGVKSWYATRKQKKQKKEELERSLEPPRLKIFTFVITLIAMACSMSFLPLFTQPVPLLLAFLVAFVTFKRPRLGMPIGGAIIGLGLLYHLSNLYFISFLGDMVVRVAMIVIWMALFVGLPLASPRYRSALAIDLGILAVIALLFPQTYFLAIPLIIASVVFFKKYVVLTTIYYVLISVPLQIVQYFNYINSIARVDWWVEAGSSPPLFVSLSPILKELNLGAMSQFNLYDMSKVINTIVGQTTWIPDWTGRTIRDALNRYLDSIPGILLFVVIIVGLAFVLLFFARVIVKEGLIGYGDKFFPHFAATLAAALFFILLNALQRPLAYTADAGPTVITLGTFATLLLTLPLAFIDDTPKKRATIQEIIDKAQKIMEQLQVLESQIGIVKETIHIQVSSPEGKLLAIKDLLKDILNKSETRFYKSSDLEQKFAELNKLSSDLDAVELELNTILSEYQIFTNGEFSKWIGKLKDIGLTITPAIKPEFQKEMSLDQRIQAIIQVLDGGRILARDVVEVVEPIYGIIKSFYDPSLPEKSLAVEFTMERLDGKEAPWIALEALYSSLNNWRRQYGREILASMNYLTNSLSPIANLTNQKEVLLDVFGDKAPLVFKYAKKAQDMKNAAVAKNQKTQLNLIEVISLKDNIQTFLTISKDVLSMLYSSLISQEQTIARLLPTREHFWEKNTYLNEHLRKATETLANPSNYKINQIMENMLKYLSHVDEAVQTLALYSERIEFLLNYPAAEAIIEELLKQRQQLTPKDLPFNPKFSVEYLRLYYTLRFSDYTFNKEEFVLKKRT